MHASMAVMGIVLIWWVSRLIRRRRMGFGNTEFDLATVNEKFSMAAETRQNLNAMEQLATDIDICNSSAQKVLRLSWMGEDDRMHEYDLYLDGENTATECMREIAAREIFDLRGVLSYQCDVLAKATAGLKYCAQNGKKDIVAKEAGEYEKAVRDMRKDA